MMVGLRAKRTFLFDLDNTLYPYEPCHRRGLARAKAVFATRPGAPRDRFLAEYLRARRIVAQRHRATAASHSRLLYFRQLCEQCLGHHAIPHALALHRAYWDGYFSAMTLSRSAKPLLRWLRQRGARIGLVTDLTEEIQLRKLQRLGLLGLVDAVVTSEEIGREKPDPGVFRSALRKLQASPADSVIIGDDYRKDIVGGKRAGLSTVWLRHRGQTLREKGSGPFSQADLVIRRLAELRRYL